MRSMSTGFQGKTQYNSIMNQQRPRGKKFLVIRAGNCDITYEALAQKLRDIGLTEARSKSECDYCVVFCPTASRVATDIDEVQNKFTDDKPAILVVMHHKHTPDCTVGDSRKHVTDRRFHLTVDCLFYRDKFLECDLNDKAWNEIQQFFEVSKISPRNKFNWWCVFGVTTLVVVVVTMTSLLGVYFGRPKD